MHSLGIRGALGTQILPKIAVLVYIAMLIFIAGYGYYLIPYVLFLLAFLFIVLNFSKYSLFSRIEQRPLVQRLLFVFILAILLRFFLLGVEQVITRDIVMYAIRSERMMAGWILYQDFAINKPPMYAYMLQTMGMLLGAGEVQFRAFFSIMDGIVAVIIFYLCTFKYNEKFSFQAAVIYALCPLPIISIGLSGHYEPLVMIFVLLATFCLLKERYNLSAFLLGIGFALKFFPLILLPFFAWKIKDWTKRINYILLFSLPIIISILPILFMSPTAFWAYIYEQSYSWPAKKSFAFAIEMLSGTDYIFGMKISFICSMLFMLSILVLFITWVLKRFNARAWFKGIIILYLIYFGLFTTAGIRYYQAEFGIADPLPIMASFALIYFTLIYFIIDKYLLPLELKIEKREELFVLATFSLILLIFSSSQNNPWYILWILPFVLAINNNKIRLLLLWIIFWNFEGLGISLLPGLALA